MSFKEKFKKIRPFLGIILLIILMLACTAIVFFSVFSALVLPLLWMIFTAWHQLKEDNKKITYLWNATRFSMWVYFSTIFLLLIYTPDWVKVLSRKLEGRSLLNVFSQESYMYGRTSIAFFCAAIVFVPFLIHYKWAARKESTDVKED